MAGIEPNMLDGYVSGRRSIITVEGKAHPERDQVIHRHDVEQIIEPVKDPQHQAQAHGQRVREQCD